MAEGCEYIAVPGAMHEINSKNRSLFLSIK